MWVLEIYQSKQGEGLWTGNFSVFVRLLGCPLRCRFCDSSYARQTHTADGDEIGAELSPEEIAGRVLLLDVPHVVITGGEPMVAPEIVELTRLLKELDCQITIETAGIADAPVYCDLMSISPKLSNSIPLLGTGLDVIRQHELTRNRQEIVQQLILRYNYQIKFVVDTHADLEEIEAYLSRFSGGIITERVMLMPQATHPDVMAEKADWIIPFCEQRGYRYCPRMQLIWYGNTRRR